MFDHFQMARHTGRIWALLGGNTVTPASSPSGFFSAPLIHTDRLLCKDRCKLRAAHCIDMTGRGEPKPVADEAHALERVVTLGHDLPHVLRGVHVDGDDTMIGGYAVTCVDGRLRIE